MSEHFDRLVDIVKRLRSPNGCPWDRKQTLYSLKQNLIEEMYELVDALDKKDIDNIKEELGDMLLHIVFHSIIAQEEGLFSLNDVIDGISEKLIRRHPHVFGDKKVDSVDEVLINWDKIKSGEKNHKKQKHYLDNIPNSLEPIQKAHKLQKQASKIGFDWHNKEDCLKKVDEELEELKTAIRSDDKNAVKEEFGDTLFSLINLSRFVSIDPSEALRCANAKFKERFDCVEDALKHEQIDLRDAALDRMESKWLECKNSKKL